MNIKMNRVFFITQRRVLLEHQINVTPPLVKFWIFFHLPPLSPPNAYLLFQVFFTHLYRNYSFRNIYYKGISFRFSIPSLNKTPPPPPAYLIDILEISNLPSIKTPPVSVYLRISIQYSSFYSDSRITQTFECFSESFLFSKMGKSFSSYHRILRWKRNNIWNSQHLNLLAVFYNALSLEHGIITPWLE